MSGRAFHAGAAGLRSLIDVLSQNEEDKRRQAHQDLLDKRQAGEDAYTRLARSQSLTDAGGYVEEPGVQGSPMFQQRLGPVGMPSARNVSPADLMGDMGSIRFDPSRSAAARLQREKEQRELAARQALANLAPPGEGAAIMGGADPQDVRSMRPPAPPIERNPVMGSPEWQKAIEFQARTAARYRAPSGGQGGKTLPSAQLDKLAMFTDLEAAARTIPALIDSAGGNVGVGPFAGRLPAFVRNSTNASGINARAVISSVEGQYMNLLSGAAVSESEAARLAPFVPNQRDDEPTVKAKAIAFANRLRQIIAAKKAAFRSAGYRLDDDGGDAPPEDAFEDGQSAPPANRFAPLIPKRR